MPMRRKPPYIAGLRRMMTLGEVWSVSATLLPQVCLWRAVRVSPLALAFHALGGVAAGNTSAPPPPGTRILWAGGPMVDADGVVVGRVFPSGEPGIDHPGRCALAVGARWPLCLATKRHGKCCKRGDAPPPPVGGLVPVRWTTEQGVHCPDAIELAKRLRADMASARTEINASIRKPAEAFNTAVDRNSGAVCKKFTSAARRDAWGSEKAHNRELGAKVRKARGTDNDPELIGMLRQSSAREVQRKSSAGLTPGERMQNAVHRAESEAARLHRLRLQEEARLARVVAEGSPSAKPESKPAGKPGDVADAVIVPDSPPRTFAPVIRGRLPARSA